MDESINSGPIARNVVARLHEIGIKPRMATRYPLSACLEDFHSASPAIVILLH